MEAAMTTATAMDLEKAMLDPAAVFHSPHEVVHAHGLSPEDKKSILLRWQEDAEALMRATEEGMPPEGQRSPAELLRTVQDALQSLDRQASNKGCCC
jgi:hypothetical protein